MVIEKMNFRNSHFHRFSYNGKQYIFDYENLILAELDQLFADCFDYIEGKTEWQDLIGRHGLDAEEAIDDIAKFAEANTFYSKKKRVFSLPDSYDTGLLSLPPVHTCNLRCAYCFAEQGDVFQAPERKFTRKMLEKALRYVYYDYLPSCKKYRIDFVSGGEPFLYFEVIQQVREIADILYQETGKPMEMWVCTNGTCFTPEILSFLDKNHINIGISIDGEQSVHDAIRVDADKKGTYDRIVSAIHTIKNSKEYSKNLKDIWGLVVVTSCTPNLVDILVHHRRLGLKNVQMKIVRLKKDSPYAIHSGNVDQLQEKYTQLFEFFSRELERDSVDYVKMILNDNDFAGKIIRRLLMRYLVMNRCQAGKNKVSIAANGDMYPCDSFVGMPEFKIGNVLTGVDGKQSFRDLSVVSNEICSKCWARYVCGGDCYHNSYLASGYVTKPDEVICKLEKHIIQLALIYLDEMANEHPDKYEYLQNFLRKRESMK